jgi:hypothetical protein
MLGGYLALGALLLYGAATRLDLGLERVFGFNSGLEAAVFVIVAAAIARELPAKGEGWRSRTVIFWVCFLFLLTLLIWGLSAHLRSGVKVPRTQPLEHLLLAVSMLASSLWSIDIVLNYRGQFRNPTRTTVWSLIVILCGGSLLTGLISVEAMSNPALMMQNWLAVLTWNETRLEILILLVGFLLCLSGLMRVMSRIIRLLAAMIIDGAIPSIGENPERTAKGLLYYLLLFCALLGIQQFPFCCLLAAHFICRSYH